MPRGRKLNIPRIKGVVMLVVAAATAFGSALTGIGAQIAATPAIAFLLGYSTEKSAGTGVAVAVVAAVSTLAGLSLAGAPAPVLVAVLLALGGTLGTMLAAPAARHPRIGLARRIAQSIGFLIGLWVLQEGLRRHIGGPMPIALPSLLRQHPSATVFLVGLVAGLLSASLQLSTGILLVPALVYVVGLPPVRAIGASLAVVALAGLLPALTYASRGLVDRLIGRWMAVGAIPGAFAGAYYAAHLSPEATLPLVAFGAVAIVLSGWHLSRAS